MSHLEDVRGAVYRAIAGLNELLPEGQVLDPHDGLVLLGPDASIDSMGFVNFLVMLEEELECETGREVNMADLLNVHSGDQETVSTVADLIDVLARRLHRTSD